ncbi:pirin family protein [Arthrobacter sp.]|uniref:pirin family protein n=1 Tax=Arthrobacter sp. TaxID=1667 RepID=UPI0026DF8EBB|nr:pirin family protein [Arthrobacter sp.]MDO5752831.1 pirin family protein [Arthrobacter sp.]
MSNVESDPQELLCHGTPSVAAGVEVLFPRLVPLGGPRAMTVRRTLPQRSRSLIGAWCFVDHYGPDSIGSSGGMAVPPHPHTGLQTISWLFSGEIEHSDSAGHQAVVRPGQLNLMTAGRGISHSEYSTQDTTVLHGVQLWTALPAHSRFTEPGFERYSPVPVRLPGATVSVFLGEAAGQHSPVNTFSPLVGAEIMLDAGACLVMDVAPGFEHGFLVDYGSPAVAGTVVEAGGLAFIATGSATVELRAGTGPVRLLLIGGEPLNESIVMWWNFIGRSHAEIVAFRADWQHAVDRAQGADPTDGTASGPNSSGDGSFPAGSGLPANVTSFTLPAPAAGRGDAPLPAPALPTVQLRPRSNPN